MIDPRVRAVFEGLMCHGCGRRWSPPPAPADLEAFIAAHKRECKGRAP